MLIAIAGGIGVGKSLVTKILNEEGKNVLICDEINKELLHDARYVRLIEKHFPTVVTNNKIDKAALRDLIFKDEEKRKLLNSIAHPLILKRIRQKALAFDGDTYVEIPLLIESGSAKMFDCVWLVIAAKEKRIERIMERDNLTEAMAKRIIEAQALEQSVICLADKIIDNSYSEEELKKQIIRLL